MKPIVVRRMILPLAWLFALSPVLAPAASPEQLDFFEKKIRPVLVQHCHACHNSQGKKKGGLAVDHRAALLAGGDSGAAIVAGKPKESLLIQALRHEGGYEMPAQAPPLAQAVIRDFERWVSDGAADPRVDPPPAGAVVQAAPWEQLREERKQWWAFQPLRDVAPPQVDNADWSHTAIDRMLFDAMQRQGLTPEAEAAPEVLVRRLHLVLTGLPPQPEVIQAYVADPTPQAYLAMVDRLLASPAFGERWARHWMDWYRYAESHGSERDPRIPYASQYRDYLVRALNADVPYNQLLREHLAGDLLPEPRINRELAINESAIGPAHLRMTPHGFGVTDAYGEQIAFTDNQIDVLSKAMLGVTVSCARCHHHKFDPISQQDFYRFYGLLLSARPSTVLIDSPEKLQTNRQAMLMLKSQIRGALAEHWLGQTNDLPDWLEKNAATFAEQRHPSQPLGTWTLLQDVRPDAFAARVVALQNQLQQLHEANAQAIDQAAFYVDLRDPASADQWFVRGNGTADRVSPAGSFALHPSGELAVRGVYPRGIYSHLLSDKHASVFGTRSFRAQGQATQVRIAGRDAQLKVPVRNYPLTAGLHRASQVNQEQLAWVPTQEKWKYWQGDLVHYELATDPDKLPQAGNKERSWFGIAEIYAGERPPQATGGPLLELLDDPTSLVDRTSLGKAYARTLREAVIAWREEQMTDAQAEFLDAFVQIGFLTNQTARLPPSLRQSLARYRELESQIPTPTRAPGVLETAPVDQPLLVRGDPRQEAEPVPRQFLEVFGGEPYTGKVPARLQLADELVSEANTLKTRVLVNRLWAYVFGRGLAASTDNLGRLGSAPSHPELLDHLALDLEQNDWSIKRALRQMTTSRAFRSASQASPASREQDPANVYLSHYTPRRLDAEAIYDSVQQLAGRTERALYLPVVRNSLNPFLTTFNAPVPSSTVSQRTHTNVPAQALAMMNGPLVEAAAESWAGRIQRDSRLATPSQKITAMVWQAYGRAPTEEELKLLLAYQAGDFDPQDELAERLAEKDTATRRLAALRQARDAVLAPVRQRLQAEVDERNAARQADAPAPVDLQPIAWWDFEKDARDQIGPMHGQLLGDARIEDGALVLAGGCLVTAPSGQALQAKSLEVLLQLDRLDQRGGGAMSLQTKDGQAFDAIVYAEQRAATWLAGSDFFRRTQLLTGPAEKEAVDQPVRLLFAYDADGTIRTYRNGKPYAAPYRKAGLRRFPPGEAHVAFGLRHGSAPAPGRMLTGRILEARLYDRALTAEEAAAASTGLLRETVSEAQLLAALTEDQRQELARQAGPLAEQEQAVAELARQVQELQERQRRPQSDYFGVAHALLNSQEFIYVD
ncbi:DUF1549 domain-containing protein [Lignipirellula cremea]|uniref:Planctomycete cytochrome C n=1 Tax=Lignipirellula cremea TaxID=2528010 RepID=A0A518DLS8_9BACT|nr:DUF1549 domain-containing protein [Lignipirellula cremea]QDU92789.1 Planctomycete cytochrome C [Lignipirellula cremea]